MFSDSSSDSDSGIRFKTTTTRQVADRPAAIGANRRGGGGSPLRSNRRTNDTYNNDRRKDFPQRRGQESRNGGDRRPPRKSSPDHHHSRKDNDSKNRTRDRDRDRDRARDVGGKSETVKRCRSPLDANRNGNNKRRSTSGDKRHRRKDDEDVKPSNGTHSSKSSKDIANDMHKSRSSNNRIDRDETQSGSKKKSQTDETRKDGGGDRLRSRVEDVKSVVNSKSERNDKDADVVASNDRKYHSVTGCEESTKSINVKSGRDDADKTSRKERVEADSVVSEVRKIDEKSISNNNAIVAAAADVKIKKSRIEPDESVDRPMIVDDEESDEAPSRTVIMKTKSKKSKHSRHGKKHKRKRTNAAAAELSDGELTPSDNDVSFNDSELDKMSVESRRKQKNNGADNKPQRQQIGPQIPDELRNELLAGAHDVIEISDSGHMSSEEEEDEEDDDEDDDDTYGPLPPTVDKMTKAHAELEERALKMRLAKLEEEGGGAADERLREEWMLELPEVRAAGLGLGPRKFRARDGPDMSDRSSWTDTPLSKAAGGGGGGRSAVETESQVSKRVAAEAHRMRIQEKDAKQEKLIKKHKKKHKRDESLLEIHQKKLRKKKKKEKDAGVVEERRRFDREIDLGVNRFDEAQKKSILKKAQLLDTRFSQGESKFL